MHEGAALGTSTGMTTTGEEEIDRRAEIDKRAEALIKEGSTGTKIEAEIVGIAQIDPAETAVEEAESEFEDRCVATGPLQAS